MIENFDKENLEWKKDKRGNPSLYYKIKIPSVSQILSSLADPEWEAFIKSVGKEKADEILKLAAYRGSAMHIFIQNFISEYAKSKDISKALKFTQIESPKILLSEEIPEKKIEEGRDLFYKFYYSDYSNQYLDVLGIELAIYSPLYFYRGKLDILYKNKLFGLSITDFKSSSGKIKKGSVKEYKYKLQLAAYVNALEEMYKSKNITINYASILCVDTHSEILQEVECSGNELQQKKDEFKTLCQSWHIKNNQEFLIK